MTLFDLSAEELQLQSMTRSFLRGFCDNTSLNAQEESENGFDTTRWRQIAELGLPAVALGADAGGAEGTLVDAAVLIREAGRAAYASPLLQALRAGVVLEHARFAAATRAAIADGEIVVLVPSDDRSLRAEESERGVVLRGAPVLVEWIAQASAAVVLVPTTGGEELLAVVPGSALIGRLTTVPSIDNERIALADLDGLVLDGDAVARVDGATARQATARADLLRASLMVGGAQEVVELTAAYVRERHQFGKPLAAFQAVKHHAARMVIAADGAQLLCDDALTRIVADPAETAIARAALFAAGRAYVDVVLTGAQLFGGVGTTVDHVLHHHFRRAKAMQLRAGRRSALLRELHSSLVVERAAAQRSLW